jgi:hypothetical protein
MMTSIRRAFMIILAILLLGGGIWLGWTLSHKGETTESVTTQTVVLSLQKQGFLVTQGYVTNERVTIDRTSGNPLKDFFFGQTIEAIGMVKVSSGVDLQKVTSTDVFVEDDRVTITLPPIETYGAEVLGDIVIVNKEGVVKRFVDHDDGYNIAANELRLSALRAAATPLVREQAEKTTIEVIESLVKGLVGGRESIVKLR